MQNRTLYTDSCCKEMMSKIKKELGLDIIQRFSEEEWSINNAMIFITNPNIELAIINRIDEISVMEISLLNFMCKPILVTAATIDNYPMIKKMVDHIDKEANLKNPYSNFISWYKNIWEGR